MIVLYIFACTNRLSIKLNNIYYVYGKIYYKSKNYLTKKML